MHYTVYSWLGNATGDHNIKHQISIALRCCPHPCSAAWDKCFPSCFDTVSHLCIIKCCIVQMSKACPPHVLPMSHKFCHLNGLLPNVHTPLTSLPPFAPYFLCRWCVSAPATVAHAGSFQLIKSIVNLNWWMIINRLKLFSLVFGNSLSNSWSLYMYSTLLCHWMPSCTGMEITEKMFLC